MKKKAIKKINKKKFVRRGVVYYLKTTFIAVSVCVVVFTGVSYFLNSQPLCANSRTCKSDLVENIDNNAIGIFQGREVVPPKIDLARNILDTDVLGENTINGEKHIYVNLATQTLYAYEGDTEVMKTLISSGRWGKTPAGNFNIWTKLRSTRMSGGSGSDYYNLPNVPYVMYFYRDYGFHGAYWHNNFGYPMSHGCVNMRIIDAQKLFNWASESTASTSGTAVSVCNEFIAPNKCVQENPVK